MGRHLRECEHGHTDPQMRLTDRGRVVVALAVVVLAFAVVYSGVVPWYWFAR